MDIENRQRTDISPYERGLSYARLLRAGYFQSQDDIARALKVSSSQVSRLLKLARLPSIVLDAFSSPADICENWGLALADTLSQPSKRPQIVNRARSIASLARRPPAREVFRSLMAAGATGRKLRSRAHDEVVKDSHGSPLFRIRQQTESIAVLLPIDKISARTMERIRSSVADILQSGSSQAPDSTSRFRAVTGEMSTF